MRSRLPSQKDLSREMIRFFELLDKRIAAQTDLESTATLSEVITAYNSLLAAIRKSGKMEN